MTSKRSAGLAWQKFVPLKNYQFSRSVLLKLVFEPHYTKIIDTLYQKLGQKQRKYFKF
jgi:hypothetical protein